MACMYYATRNQPWYVRPTLVSKSFCFALIFSVKQLLLKSLSQSIFKDNLSISAYKTKYFALRLSIWYKAAWEWKRKQYGNLIRSAMHHGLPLPFFTIFWGASKKQNASPFWWQKHQKGRKKGHACRVRLVKTVGPFFFGLIFSGPFVTWSVKDLVSHQFGTINSCMMKWCAQKSFKLITQIRATRWPTKDP